MKVPETPTKLIELLPRVTPDLAARIATGGLSKTVDGAYLHWDQLRYREPPEGLTRESWWLGLKLARMGSSTILPFMDRFQSRFTFSLTEEVLIHLLHLDQDSAGAVRSSEVMDSNQRDEYIVRSLIEEAITSSQLEGASTTRKVAEKMLREARPPRTDGERMILNNYKTMRAIQMFRGEPFTQRRVLELHRLVTEGTLKDPADAGRLRNSDDVFVFDRDNGERLHIPPPHQELPDRLELLCDFANRAESDLPFVHPVLRAILLHFMLGYDHPFVDGNGRTARALFYWSMLRSGYWMTEFISISHFLRKAPVQYGMAYLYAETDEGDTTYFLIHQLQTIRKAVDALHDFLARRTAEQRSLERLIAPASSLGQSLNHRQRAILAHAIRKPGAEYRIAGHKSLHAVTYQTARTDLVGLANLGLLDLHLVGKAFVFTAPPDLKRRIGKLEAGPHAS